MALYVVGAIVSTFPLALHLTDQLIPSSDTLLNSWILAWDVHALTTNPLHLFDANIFYPFPEPLTYSETMLTGALMVAPVELLTANPVLAHNLLTLASLTLAGVGTYLLVAELTGDRASALLAGALFAFCPFRQGQLDHLQLQQIGFLPLTLLFLHRALRDGKTRDYLLFTLFGVCQALASFYLMYLMAIALSAFIAVEIVSQRRFWRIANLARLTGSFAVMGVCILPIAVAYERTQATFNFQWPIQLIRDLSALPQDYLSISSRSLLYASLLPKLPTRDFANEHQLFPGIVVVLFSLLALVRVALLRARGSTREIVRYTLIAAIAFELAFGVSYEASPYLWLYRVVPGFSAMRVATRFDFLTMLALAVLAGFGLSWLRTVLRDRTSPRMSYLAFGSIAALGILELLSRPLDLQPVPVGSAVPPVYAWLATQPTNAPILELPIVSPSVDAPAEYVYFSTYHWHPTVNGYSGFYPPAYSALTTQLEEFPDPTAVENLRGLGVRYVVVHMDQLRDDARKRLADANLASLPVTLAATFGSDRVYELSAVADQRSPHTVAGLDFPSVIARGIPAAVGLEVDNDGSTPLPIPVPVQTEVDWQSAPATHGSTQLPLFLPAGFRTIRGVDIGAAPGPDESAEVHVDVSGVLNLDESHNVRVVDLPTSLDASSLSAAVERVYIQQPARAGANVTVDALVRNTGRAVWLAGPGEMRGAIGIAARSWKVGDRIVQTGPNDGSLATDHTTWNVNPDQVVEFELSVPTPASPGDYNLVLDLLSEQVSWFSDQKNGSQTVVPVHVE